MGGVEEELERLINEACEQRNCTQDDLSIEDEDELYEQALKNMLDKDEGRTWAAGNIRMGDIILGIARGCCDATNEGIMGESDRVGGVEIMLRSGPGLGTLRVPLRCGRGGAPPADEGRETEGDRSGGAVEGGRDAEWEG